MTLADVRVGLRALLLSRGAFTPSTGPTATAPGPVGRLVRGSLYKPQTTDAEGKRLR